MFHMFIVIQLGHLLAALKIPSWTSVTMSDSIKLEPSRLKTERAF